MTIDERAIRRMIREELNESSLRAGSSGIRRMPLFDEEREAVRLVRALAALYDDLRGSPHTESVMEMEDAYRSTRSKLQSQQMIDGPYPLVGMAKAIAEWGLPEEDEGGRD